MSYAFNILNINLKVGYKLAVNVAVFCLVAEYLQGNVSKLLLTADGEYLLLTRLDHGAKISECADVRMCKYANEVCLGKVNRNTKQLPVF